MLWFFPFLFLCRFHFIFCLSVLGFSFLSDCFCYCSLSLSLSVCVCLCVCVRMCLLLFSSVSVWCFLAYDLWLSPPNATSCLHVTLTSSFASFSFPFLPFPSSPPSPQFYNEIPSLMSLYPSVCDVLSILLPTTKTVSVSLTFLFFLLPSHILFIFFFSFIFSCFFFFILFVKRKRWLSSVVCHETTHKQTCVNIFWVKKLAKAKRKATTTCDYIKDKKHISNTICAICHIFNTRII